MYFDLRLLGILGLIDSCDLRLVSWESVTFVLLGEWLHGQENNSYLSKILNNVQQQGWLYIGGRQNNYFSKMFVLQGECLGMQQNNYKTVYV